MGEFLIHTDTGQELVLEHHGIKGQKWGVRRFQNPDGSYTEEGRKRYSRSKDNIRAKNIVREIQKTKKLSSDSLNSALSDEQRQNLSSLANKAKTLQAEADRRESEYYRLQSKMLQEATPDRLRNKPQEKYTDAENEELRKIRSEIYAKSSSMDKSREAWDNYINVLDKYNRTVGDYARSLLGAYANEKVSEFGYDWKIIGYVNSAIMDLDSMNDWQDTM